MKFSLNWLTQHLETDASNKVLVDAFTRLGMEVESVIDWAKMLSPFMLGRITHVEKHPQADRLCVCTVEAAGNTHQIVCGGSNVRQGLIGIVALPGTAMPGGLVIKKARIRDVESAGMLCSYNELGLGEFFEDIPHGIADLSSETDRLGTVAEALHLGTPTIHVDITPNRPDLLGVRGIARELAADGLGTLKSCPYSTDLPAAGTPKHRVIISKDATNACPFFALAQVKMVNALEAPSWMQVFLQSAGVTPQGFAVDVTNFLCLDQARPLHAFDAEQIQGDLTVRLAKAGETFEALNDKTYTLNEGDLVICDDTGIVSLAGVMGGKRSAIGPNTKTILLESATFCAKRVSQTSRRLQLISDASIRFERGVDPLSACPGLAQALHMLTEAGGHVTGIATAGKETFLAKTFSYNVEAMQRVTGLSVTSDVQHETFSALGLQPVQKTSSTIEVTPPSWRFDLDLEENSDACLVEEVLRFQGFDALPDAPLPESTTHPNTQAFTQQIQNRARRLAVSRTLTEVITWSFISAKKAEHFHREHTLVKLANPRVEDMSVMRPSLLPGLLDAVHFHQARTIDMEGGLFEFGHTYQGTGPFGQNLELACVVPPSLRTSWQGQAPDLWTTKAHSIAILKGLGMREDSFTLSTEPAHLEKFPAYHPGQTGVWVQGNKVLGVFGALHPHTLKLFGLKGPVFALEIFLDRLMLKNTVPKEKTPSSRQRTGFDLGFVLPKTVSCSEMETLMRKTCGKTLVSCDVFDIFEDEKRLGADQKYLAFKFFFQPIDDDKTDIGAENHMEAIIDAVKPLGAILRRDAGV